MIVAGAFLAGILVGWVAGMIRSDMRMLALVQREDAARAETIRRIDAALDKASGKGGAT